MKEEIPQAVIDSHVKNATNRSEKRKVENTTDENSSTGKMRSAVCSHTQSTLACSTKYKGCYTVDKGCYTEISVRRVAAYFANIVEWEDGVVIAEQLQLRKHIFPSGVRHC